MSKSKRKTKASTPATTTTLALSSLHTRLETLEEEHEWLLKQIKRKRKELNNFVENLRSLATEMFHRTQPLVVELIAIEQDIHNLFEDVLNNRKFGKQTKKQIEQIYQSLQLGGLIRPKMRNEDASSELDELFQEDTENPRNETSNKFDDEESYHSQTPPLKDEDSRQIRQTFLRLAEIFHPDKVTDKETQLHHEEIMKEINRAYRDRDFARLLEIEEKHLSGETIATSEGDDLTRRCEFREQENHLLRQQYANLKQELNLIKKTPEGAMVSDYRRAMKEGVNPIELLLAEVKQELTVLKEVRNFIKDFQEQKIPVKEFLKGPANLNQIKQDMVEQLFEEMFGISFSSVEF